MLQTILDLQRSLNLSQGELLDIVQHVVGDTVRTIDRLTQAERAEVIAVLEHELRYGRLPSCVSA